MIYLNEEKVNIINKFSDNDVYVLTDFDRTLTLGSSITSWSVLSRSDKVPKDYVILRQKYYDYYRPIEIDQSLPYEIKNELMKEWWMKHINLFVKYKISEDIVTEAARNLRVMSFRSGAKEFLKNMYERNIPVIIISAGIGNFIKEFLIMNDSFYNNIHIVSNFIKFENGYAVGVEDNITHSLNKNEVSMPDNVKKSLALREHVILLGDGLDDVKMVSEQKRDEALKIGFLEENVEVNKPHYLKTFDVVCTDNTGFDELAMKIRILKR